MNPYKILGIAEDATLEQIKAAYRERARRYHPDAGGDAWAFQQVQQAYDMLLQKHGNPNAGEGGASAATPTDVSKSPPDQAGGTTRSMRPHEMAIIAGVIALLVALMYWQWVWRLIAFAGATSLGAFAAWLFVLSRTDVKENRLLNIGGGAVASVLAFALVYCAFFIGGYPAIPVKSLNRTSPVVFVSWEERDIPQKQESQGSAFVYASENGKLSLYTNSHCLNLASIVERVSKQRDRTANVTNYKVEVVFPSGQRRTVQRIGESSNPSMIDAARIEVSSQGLVEGADFVVVPIIDDVVAKLSVKVDDEVRAVGAPNGLDGTASKGWVTSIRRSSPGEPPFTAVQHSAPIYFGSSGGPLFLCRGQSAYCIGINTVLVGGQTIGLAHSIDDIAKHDYVWADATPSGAVDVIGKVYGIAAAVGDQKAQVVGATPPFRFLPGKDGKPLDFKTPQVGDNFTWYRTIRLLMVLGIVLSALWKWFTHSTAKRQASQPVSENQSHDVRCPNCHRVNVIASANRGSTIRCLHCQTDFDAQG